MPATKKYGKRGKVAIKSETMSELEGIKGATDVDSDKNANGNVGGDLNATYVVDKDIEYTGNASSKADNKFAKLGNGDAQEPLDTIEEGDNEQVKVSPKKKGRSKAVSKKKKENETESLADEDGEEDKLIPKRPSDDAPAEEPPAKRNREKAGTSESKKAVESKKGRKAKDEPEPEAESESEPVKEKPLKKGRTAKVSPEKNDDTNVAEEGVEEKVTKKRGKRPTKEKPPAEPSTRQTRSTRKNVAYTEIAEDEDDEIVKKPKKTATKKAVAQTKKTDENEPEPEAETKKKDAPKRGRVVKETKEEKEISDEAEVE